MVILVKSLFFRPLYLNVVRSLTDIKNNFVRSYPEKRSEELVVNYDEEAIRVVFYWRMRSIQMSVELPHKVHTYIEYHDWLS
jgi:hypothetical protein